MDSPVSLPIEDAEPAAVEPGPAADEAAPAPDEAAAPFRMVGRNAEPESNTSPEAATGQGEAKQAEAEQGEAAEVAASGLPALELQGTSVVENRPVAVVNYQRVFEGDIILGARVVKIFDRAVELSYEGRRFTIRF